MMFLCCFVCSKGFVDFLKDLLTVFVLFVFGRLFIRMSVFVCLLLVFGCGFLLYLRVEKIDVLKVCV